VGEDAREKQAIRLMVTFSLCRMHQDICAICEIELPTLSTDEFWVTLKDATTRSKHEWWCMQGKLFRNDSIYILYIYTVYIHCIYIYIIIYIYTVYIIYMYLFKFWPEGWPWLFCRCGVKEHGSSWTPWVETSIFSVPTRWGTAPLWTDMWCDYLNYPALCYPEGR